VRRRRKRVRFKVPERPAIAVRALWESASEEERKQAHSYTMAILASWTGRASWKETAARLSLPLVRVHQLSQQAVSGMLAGLLVQPRTRRRRGSEAAPSAGGGLSARLGAQPEDDPVQLRKHIRALETKLSRTEDLVRVLQEMPWHRASASGDKEAPSGSATRRKTATKSKRPAARPRPEPGEKEGDRDSRDGAPEGEA